ncbi:hypothetical protein R5031_32460 (plasmid) [Pseudomonas aeruginosa]|uniref:hypothetical protein n=1 Tax=Pseudomonas TaxID=286 RepID=UPI00295EDE04|nr:hypothetical protein [Pseudomonas aeruginosa]WOU23220.1 hypothetical protein R5031_32460 [Pseudomonas aeruginosa]WOU35768.1 hypothetical protein R5027_32480 [Pseudomonas aeruginosa]
MADALRPLAWATIYSHPGRKDIVEIGDADPVRERDAETWGWRHRRVQLVEIPAGHVVVPRELLERIRSQLDLRAEFDQTYPPETQPVNDDARLFLELHALLSEQEGGKQ